MCADQEMQMRVTLQFLLHTISVTTRSVVKLEDTRKEILMPFILLYSQLIIIMWMVSITLGNPRKHVWTYAIGISDNGTHDSTCPCAVNRGPNPPSFVSDHYYCESGDTEYAGHDPSAYYTSDPVWDGLDCSDSVNCCAHPDMPWFLRQFAKAQETFIEARICHSGNFSDEGILVESMELYMQ